MIKHIKSSSAALAALAACAVLITPALAQQGGDPGELEGAPRQYNGQKEQYPYRGEDREWRTDERDWRGDAWRRREPDFQRMEEQCSRVAIQEAWRRNYYSAQYEDAPRLFQGRRGWEMVGRMKLHDRRGFTYAHTVCQVGNGGSRHDVRFDFLR